MSPFFKAAGFVICFGLTLCSVSHSQDIEVYSTWSPEQLEDLERFQVRRFPYANIQWHSLRSSQYAYPSLGDIVQKKPEIAIWSDPPSQFLPPQQDPSDLVISGLGLPAEGETAPHLGPGINYSEDTNYVTIDPFFVITSPSLHPGQGLNALEDLLSEYGATSGSRSPQSWVFDYKRVPKTGQGTVPDFLHTYQNTLVKKGCFCGPSASCKSLTPPEFEKFLKPNDNKPRCPRKPPCGPSAACK